MKSITDSGRAQYKDLHSWSHLKLGLVGITLGERFRELGQMICLGFLSIVMEVVDGGVDFKATPDQLYLDQ